MKKSPLTTILLGALAASVLASAALCWKYMSHERQRRGLQAQMQNEIAALQRRQTSITALANDLLEYSRTHKDIEPILESAGLTNRNSGK
jgi:hypothetical protein